MWWWGTFHSQYSILVTVVILSAFVPTLIAQRFFQPTLAAMHEWGRIYAQKINGSVQPQAAPGGK